MSTKNRSTFVPRARLMLLLGDQLIRDAGVAVFELVKNAYDADARKCSVVLRGVHVDHSDAQIVIQDNGQGMDVNTVKTVWLSPGTRHRLTQREQLDDRHSRTERYHRLPLGEKGVGRFAVHKLGNKVTMITRAAGQDEVVVTIDWKEFDSDQPLDSVPVAVETRRPRVFMGADTGTRLEVSDLRELPWTRRRVRSLHRAVTSICSPTSGPEEFEATLVLDPDPNGWLAGMLTPSQAMRQALFHMKGRIEKDRIIYSYAFRPPRDMDRVEGRKESNKQVLLPQHAARRGRAAEDDERVIDLQSHDIGIVEFDFSIFDRDRQTLALLPGDSRALTDFLNQNGGVRVYRDGVRVYDFGELGNDWLDLGGRRINVPTRRIGNNQIIGTVRLSLADSRDLVEKTNREGFVENAAETMFRRAVKFAITQAESERNKDKQRIRRAYSRPKRREPVLGELEELRGELDALQLQAAEHARLNTYLDQIDSQYREVLDRLLTAAGAGLNLALVLHEVEKNIKTLYEAIVAGAIGDAIIERVRHLAELVDSLTWLTRQSGKRLVEASDLIHQCLFAWSFRYERHNVTVENGLEAGDPPFAITCNRRLVLTALMNLVDNSIYWLGTKARERKLYLGTTFELTGKPAIVVADNGPGLSDPPEYLTMAFFTRKPDGMGLGLHLADEIMRSQGGSLQFPQRNDITLPSDYDGAVVLLEFLEQK